MSQMIIRIDPELKEKLYKLVRAEGKPARRMGSRSIFPYVSSQVILAGFRSGHFLKFSLG